MARRLLLGALALVAVLALAAGVAYLARHELMRRMEGLPPFTHSAGEVRDLAVAMRDGAKLATTVYEPAGDGPWPTVLFRNPYDKAGSFMRLWCDRMVRYGFACVYQEARGQGESEGEWNPMVNEANDGADTLRWLVAQNFQDGNIGLVGPSYLAAVQWAVADQLPPEVKTLVPSVFTTDPYRILYQDGMFRQETFTAWTALMPRRGMAPEGAGEAYQRAIEHRPHMEVDEKFFGGRIPWYREWISSPSLDAPLWQNGAFHELKAAPEQLEIPVLMIGGWYDIALGPQMQDWQRLASRSRSRYIIGPWTHIGEGSPGFETPGADGGLMQWKPTLDWLGHQLRGEELDQKLGVATYVIGANEWIERKSWPPDTRPLRVHLASAAASTSCDGGRLLPGPPPVKEQVSYRYDPNDPVPTRGGAGMLAFVLPGFDGAPAANVWQDGLCERQDVLSFLSEPLEAPLHIAGEVEVVLTVSSSAPDTAFTAKLVEVFPDGRAINIRDNITSLAFRNGSKTPLAYTPGEPASLRIRMWPIEWEVAKGSRLRLDVSSSDFPKFHAHPNRAGLWSEQTGVDVATQTLFLGEGSNGWVQLPMLRD